MIVPMKKCTIICLETDKIKTLNELRDMGVLHVELCRDPFSDEHNEAVWALNKTENAIGALSTRKIDKNKIPPAPDLTGADAAKKVNGRIDEINDIDKKLDVLHRDRERMVPWGQFSHETVKALKEKDVYVYLCAGIEEDIEKIPEDAAVEILKEIHGRLYFAVVSQRMLDTSSLPLAQVPEMSLEEIKKQINDLETKREKTENELDKLVPVISILKEHKEELEEELEFYTNRDGMASEGKLAYIKGYIPENECENLSKNAREHGWAILLQETDPDDRNVPTMLRIPKIFRIAKPIFSFIGITPGYREWDVSICFLFFFTIFFGMIVGDAVYGAIFLILAVICRFIFRDPKYRLTLNLFMTLSITTIIWGVMTTTYFGVPDNFIPTWMKGFKTLTDPKVKNQNIQLLCFIIAAIHLSFAHGWKSLIYFFSKWKLKALGEVGWGMLIWANCFTAIKLIVFPEWTYPTFGIFFYAIGFVLILVFGVNWKDFGQVFNLPFSFIGSFVDVLSYIRLFAVGLSTYYIANSFNNMGAMVLDISPWLIIGTVIVILIGHLLNIALALMAVLVHGIRLNTLEFSNHMQLEWAGIFYKPFKKNSNSKNLNTNTENNKKETQNG